MSYCRWSSDDWSCDLYCYEDVSGGWTTHVGCNRIIGDVPKELDLRIATPEAWLDSHREAMRFVETAEREPIGLPHDGETFNDPTLETFKQRLLDLRAVGYRFPDYVLEDVEEEIRERALSSAGRAADSCGSKSL